MKNLLFYFSLTAFVFLACASSPSDVQSNNIEASNSKIQNPKSKIESPPEVLKLVKHELVDKEGTGLVASTYLLPEGWTSQDRLYWEYNDPTVPIRLKGLMQSPDGNMSIQIFPA